MKGYSHALSGMLGWGFIATPSMMMQVGPLDIPTNWQLVSVTPAVYALGMIISPGMALLPDSDHHSGTIAHSLPGLGPIPSPTAVLCRIVGKISGGHRHGTHSIIGTILMVALVALLTRFTYSISGHEIALGSGILTLFLVAFGLNALRVNIGKGSQKLNRWVFSLFVAGMVTWFFPEHLEALPLLALVGILAHLIGDSLTVGGVPWFYPLKPKPPEWVKDKPIIGRMWQSNGWFALPILGKTESRREEVFAVLMSVATVLLMGVAAFNYLK